LFHSVLLCTFVLLIHLAAMKQSKNPEIYQVVVVMPKENQQLLHNEKARRQLSGRPSQNLNEIASELLAGKLAELEKGG
jgi:hypothetical protein